MLFSVSAISASDKTATPTSLILVVLTIAVVLLIAAFAGYYPPYTRLARVLIRGKDGAKASAAGREAAEVLRGATKGSPLQVLGPSNAPLSLLEGFHRFHILLKSPTAVALAELFSGPAGRALEKLKGADATVDIDPQSML